MVVEEGSEGVAKNPGGGRGGVEVVPALEAKGGLAASDKPVLLPPLKILSKNDDVEVTEGAEEEEEARVGRPGGRPMFDDVNPLTLTPTPVMVKG